MNLNNTRSRSSVHITRSMGQMWSDDELCVTNNKIERWAADMHNFIQFKRNRIHWSTKWGALNFCILKITLSFNGKSIDSNYYVCNFHFGQTSSWQPPPLHQVHIIHNLIAISVNKQQQPVTVSSDSSSSSKSNMHRQIVIAVIVMHREQPASHSHSQQLADSVVSIYQCNLKLWQFWTPMGTTNTDKGPSDTFHSLWTDTSGNAWNLRV